MHVTYLIDLNYSIDSVSVIITSSLWEHRTFTKCYNPDHIVGWYLNQFHAFDFVYCFHLDCSLPSFSWFSSTSAPLSISVQFIPSINPLHFDTVCPNYFHLLLLTSVIIPSYPIYSSVLVGDHFWPPNI
jgi:hypothetical protein